jgi:hypothetical protein
MRYVIRDFTMDITCTVDDLSTMWERGQKLYGQLPRTGSQRRIMRPSIAQKPCYLYDPVLATWEDFNLAEVDGSGMRTMTGARDPRQPRGPRVIGANHHGQRALLPRERFPAMVH